MEANEGVTLDRIALDTQQDLPIYTVPRLTTQSANSTSLSRRLDQLTEADTGKYCRVRVIMRRLKVSD